MSRRLLTILAFVCALLLTVGACWQVMLYKVPPHGALALWLPFIVLLGAHGGLSPFVALFQFPVLAVIFVLASRRFPPRIVLVVMLVLYALCCWGAFLMLGARLWT